MDENHLDTNRGSLTLFKLPIIPEIEIPAFEEAFDPYELKKFYQDRDSTSTLSPKSFASPDKNTPIYEKEYDVDHYNNQLTKDPNFCFKLNTFDELNEVDKDQALENIWRINEDIDIDFDEIKTTNQNFIMAENLKTLKKNAKLIRKPPFTIIRNCAKKLKISEPNQINIHKHDHIHEIIYNNNESIHQNNPQPNNLPKSKRVIFFINRKPIPQSS